MKVGDYVSRNSYKNDTIFKILNIKNNIVYLKGVDYRLYADAPMDDLKIVKKEDIKDDFKVDDVEFKEDRDEFFYLPGKVLHLDSDNDYLKRCMNYYKKNNVYAVGKRIDEKDLKGEIRQILEEIRPDIVIITGHDSFRKGALKSDIKSYKNSLNFVNAVKEARRYEKSHDKLIIIAGACQSDYEELIKAGANFASSPKRINIHALDPAIIATNLALTERNKTIDLLELLSKTRNGKDGMGGLISNGLMFVGYPR